MAAAAARRRAQDNVPVHWVQRASCLALRFREPGVRACGDLRTAVARGAVAVGSYCLLFGSIYLNLALGRETLGVDMIQETSWSIACIIGTMNAALYYACKNLKNDTHLQYVLCGMMTLYLMDVPFSAVSYVSIIAIYSQTIPALSLTIRIALGVCHLCLIYCLLLELREKQQSMAGHRSEVACDNIPEKEQSENNDLVSI